jgi:hypothetical protein
MDGESVNDTTRRFPRSLAEAFPDERFPAIEGSTTKPRSDRPIVVFCTVLGLAVLCAIAMGAL